MINLWHLDSLLVNHLLSLQIHRSEMKLWSAFPLAHICMHMNGTKSNVTALMMLKCSFLFATLFMIFSIFLNLVLHFQPYQPDCCLDNCADHWKTHIRWTLLFSNSHKHLRNCGRFINLVPSTTWDINFRLVPAASDCCLALDEMDFAWPACHSAEAHILYGGWRMKTAQLSSACFKGACLIVWQSVEVAEECEGL